MQTVTPVVPPCSREVPRELRPHDRAPRKTIGTRCRARSRISHVRVSPPSSPKDRCTAVLETGMVATVENQKRTPHTRLAAAGPLPPWWSGLPTVFGHPSSRPWVFPQPLCCHVAATCRNWASTCRLSTRWSPVAARQTLVVVSPPVHHTLGFVSNVASSVTAEECVRCRMERRIRRFLS